MNKIPTLFLRDGRVPPIRVINEVTPGCEWVLAGEGIATRKYDGTCVMLDRDGSWWARREVHDGRTPPANYVPISTDRLTGKTIGWEPIEQSGFAKWWGLAVSLNMAFLPGTYELIGPKINGNPENVDYYILVPHEHADPLPASPRDFEGLRWWMYARKGIEGIVWHHPDGRMAKLKRKDFA